MGKYSFLLVTLLYVTNGYGQLRGTVQSPADNTLRSFSKWYANNLPDSIYTLFTDGLKSKLTTEAWRQVFPQVKTAVGVLGDFAPDASTRQATNFVAFGSVDSIGLVMSLDSTYHIQGLFPKQRPTKSVYHTNYKVSTSDGELAGELLVPAHAAGHKLPVALIVAGSGPTDRNGNNVMGVSAAPYKMLAEELGKNGIASFRYDKRFIGESQSFKGGVDSLKFEDMLGDVRACIRKLKADTNFSAIVVIGHSEGALLGCIAAREEKADRFISLSGVGEDAAAVLKRQLSLSFPPQTMTVVNSWLDSLQKGYRVAVPYSSPVAGLFNPSVQTYLISWFKYDPAVEIAKLKMPVLIVQGLTDLQVGRRDAEKLKAAAPRASMVLVDSMNHVLKDAPLDRKTNMATYSNENLPLDKELVWAVVAFIKGAEEK